MASNPGESAEKSQNKEIAKHATESTNSTISSVYYAPEIRMRRKFIHFILFLCFLVLKKRLKN